MAGQVGKPRTSDYVFINCPFDQEFWPKLEVIGFTIVACGFWPRCALMEDNSSDVRLDKIVRMIGESRYSIHDLSRVTLDTQNSLPRFNMPFELGLDLGCERFRSRRPRKQMLVLERTRYETQKCLSDIAGQDLKAHGDDLDKLMRIIRHWLADASNRRTIPGEQTIRDWHASFSADLPEVCRRAGIDGANLPFSHYVEFARTWVNTAARDG